MHVPLCLITRYDEPQESVSEEFTRIMCNIMDLKGVGKYKGMSENITFIKNYIRYIMEDTNTTQ